MLFRLIKMVLIGSGQLFFRGIMGCPADASPGHIAAIVSRRASRKTSHMRLRIDNENAMIYIK